MDGDGIGLVEALLGLDGFRVLDVAETEVEATVTVETTADFTGCGRCAVRAEAQDRIHRRRDDGSNRAIATGTGRGAEDQGCV